jgi:hypothetical protein
MGVSASTVRSLRASGHDAAHVSELGMNAALDGGAIVVVEDERHRMRKLPIGT